MASGSHLIVFGFAIAVLFCVGSAQANAGCWKYPTGVCNKQMGPYICGTNGRTYYNECLFCQDAKYQSNLQIRYMAPCA